MSLNLSGLDESDIIPGGSPESEKTNKRRGSRRDGASRSFAHGASLRDYMNHSVASPDREESPEKVSNAESSTALAAIERALGRLEIAFRTHARDVSETLARTSSRLSALEKGQEELRAKLQGGRFVEDGEDLSVSEVGEEEDNVLEKAEAAVGPLLSMLRASESRLLDLDAVDGVVSGSELLGGGLEADRVSGVGMVSLEPWRSSLASKDYHRALSELRDEAEGMDAGTVRAHRQLWKSAGDDQVCWRRDREALVADLDEECRTQLEAVMELWDRGHMSFSHRLEFVKRLRKLRGDTEIRRRVALTLEERGKMQTYCLQVEPEVATVARRELLKHHIRSILTASSHQSLATSSLPIPSPSPSENPLDSSSPTPPMSPKDLDPIDTKDHRVREAVTKLEHLTAHLVAVLAAWELRTGGQTFEWRGIPYRQALVVEQKLIQRKEKQDIKSRAKRAF